MVAWGGFAPQVPVPPPFLFAPAGAGSNPAPAGAKWAVTLLLGVRPKRLPPGYLLATPSECKRLVCLILALMSSNPQVHQARDPNSSAICSRSQSVNPLTPGFLILHKESLFDGDFPPNGSLSGCSTLPSLEVRGGSMTLLWDQLASLIELTK